MRMMSTASEASADCAKSVSVEYRQTCIERIQAAKLLLLSWDMLMSAERERKPQMRSAAARFLAVHTHKTALLSNYSTRLPADVQAILGRHGISVSEERIHLAGQHTLQYLRQSGRLDIATIELSQAQDLDQLVELDFGSSPRISP